MAAKGKTLSESIKEQNAVEATSTSKKTGTQAGKTKSTAGGQKIQNVLNNFKSKAGAVATQKKALGSMEKVAGSKTVTSKSSAEKMTDPTEVGITDG